METTALSCLINIFVDPKKALADVRGHTAWLWYPLIISILITTAVLIWYYATADIGSLQQQVMSMMGSKYNPDQLEQIRSSLTRGRFIFQAAAGGIIAVLVIYLLQALYLFLISKVAGYEVQEFGKWFSLVSWTSLPNVLVYIAMAITYLFSQGKSISVYDLNVASLNTLIFHFKPADHWFGLATSVSLTTFWVLGLMVMGFSLWTKKSPGKSAVVVLTPYVLIYGLIILIKLT